MSVSPKLQSSSCEIGQQANRSFLGLLLVLVLALGCFFVLSLATGSITFSLSEVWQILREGNPAEAAPGNNIIWKIRLPRVLASMFLGAALALSGYLLQVFFHNPIAGPYLLGISSGAKLGVALFILSSTPLQLRPGQTNSIFFALAGSLLSMLIVLVLARKVSQPSLLIVSGMMLGYLTTAVTDILTSFADDASIATLQFWTKGSFSGMRWESVHSMAILVPLCCIASGFLAKPITAYQLGDTYAQNSGVRLKLFRLALVMLSSLLAAIVTTFAGPISFVGIAVPHLTRGLLKTSKPHYLIPTTALMGALFCLVCDLIARSLIAPLEIRLSAITALFGAPVILWVILKRNRTPS